MNPVTHLLAGWLTANSADLCSRDRALVTLAGIAPDIDGAGVLAEMATRGSGSQLFWWSDYHHVLCHNLAFGLALTAAAAALAVRRGTTAALALAAFHLHLLGDLAGARGPDGYQWPLAYLLPFSDRWQLTWSGQWALNAWPNILITILLLGMTLYLAWRRGFSPLEMVSKKADAAFVSTLRNRFGTPEKYHPS